MKRVAIIGVGLIGGSLGMALRKSGKGYSVTGLGRNIGRLRSAKRLGAVDEYSIDWETGVKNADIIVICTPVDLVAAAVKKIFRRVKSGAVITDAGSVKGSVLKEVNGILDPGPRTLAPVFVGSHPMAGSEKTGVGAAKRDLFRGASVVLTPERKTPGRAVAAVEKLWRDAGAVTVKMTAGEHDRIVAATSHLPHAIAFTLSSLVGKTAKSNGKAGQLLAGSFRDMTRIAGSNAADWAVISAANGKELNKAISEIIKKLREVGKNVTNRRKLEKIFMQGKIARQKLLNKTGSSKQ
ncbi:MAG: prephenate dehydrogenase/arogenate dehydrogenase family protein [Elusimicrobiota bacterium]